jgi:hypothetical protein
MGVASIHCPADQKSKVATIIESIVIDEAARATLSGHVISANCLSTQSAKLENYPFPGAMFCRF